MKILLWLFLRLSRLLGCPVILLTVEGRTAYDRLRKSTGGELERATDGLTFKWKGCRVGYEMTRDELVTAEPDGVTCAFCGDRWHHSLTRVDSKGRTVPDRNPADRCETCARKTAERRGVPWETIR